MKMRNMISSRRIRGCIMSSRKCGRRSRLKGFVSMTGLVGSKG